MLHITNGDSTVQLMRAAGIEGEILPWRDCLHEGPVPAGLDLEALSEVRARYLAGVAPVAAGEVAASFRERDRTLRGFRDHGEVLLWFEHDLYDQLQILQILDFLADAGVGGTRVSMICIDAFPGVEPFYGLGMLNPEQLNSLRGSEQMITERQLELARRGWATFRAPDPGGIVDLLAGDTTSLPYLGAALLRHLEEFPSTADGLSRTERQILGCLAESPRSPGELFRAGQELEPRPYLGDWSFWTILGELTRGPHPLVRTANGEPVQAPYQGPGGTGFRRQRLLLTEDGQGVRRGDRDRLAIAPLDRWLGGVHLGPGRPCWRWDASGCRLVRP